MIRKVLFILFILFAGIGLYAQSGALKGKIFDKESGEAIPFANIVVELNGNQIGGGVSDFDGNYTIKPISAGKYTVRASYVGYQSLQMDGVIINNDRVRFLDLKLAPSTQDIDEVVVVGYQVPLIDKDNTQQGGTVTSEEISKMPGRSPEAVASTVGGVYQEDGEVKSVRGSRDGSTVYYIDGVKVRGSNNLPKSSIAEISVVTGGLPARYGDATGGVISITTKGASRTYFGGLELSTSKLLDDFNENIIGFNLSGPIWQRTITDPNNPENTYKEPILGFFLAGEGTYIEDGRPSAVGVWKAKDEILDSISRTPLLPMSGDQMVGIQTASFLGPEDFENIATRQNVANSRAMISAKLDFQPLKNVVFTLGGNLNYRSGSVYSHNRGRGDEINEIGYGEGEILYANSTAFPNQIFNSDNNAQFVDNTWRVFGRLTHKFGSSDNENAIIKNAYYTIQVDYSKDLSLRQDRTHKDNFFGYGYVGEFNTYKAPSYQYGEDTIAHLTGFLMDNFRDTLLTFDPGTLNPEMTRYTELFYEYFGSPENSVQLQTGNGLVNGEIPTPIYGLLQNPGEVHNQYYKSDDDQFRVSAFGAADIKNHEISFGFEFEQRKLREYSIAPRNLWQLARDWSNFHISELDFSNPIVGYIQDSKGNDIFNDTINYNRQYNRNSQALFDIKFRQSQNMDVDGLNWIDIDSYSPAELSIDFFSADEIFNNGNSYVTRVYGYDIYGNKLNTNPTFEDFFTKTYTYEGRQFYSREIAAFEPIYMAGYIQDKFAFNDLIFNIGLRIDRYDANQKVQKDPYLVYSSRTVAEQDILPLEEVPENIPTDAYVYVDNRFDARNIVGYRSGEQWYDEQGMQINDATTLYRNGSIQPYLIAPEDNPGDKSFLDAFEDFREVYTLMPRISFSFPISDEALFFAHYDILTTRPGRYQSRLNPYDYLYIDQKASSYFTNANLQPEKTIDYELGFQQKLTNASSLKISAFVREQRDMIQVRQLAGAYPINMKTYDNMDFGTIKGFTLGYDLRRTNNVSLKAFYTLQFANATGSDANTGTNLIASGQPNLRTTLPTDNDQRHALSIIFDYRFDEGAQYNGPNVFGRDILANAGANFVIRSGSGTPFTKRNINSTYVEGTINGSRMPWRTTVNLRVDKSFTLELGKTEGKKKKTDLNVYFDVANLLDTKNVMRVYTYTGNNDDDGYLTAAKNQQEIANAIDPEAYENYYSMIINNPARYSLPRRIRLGLIFSF